MKTTCKILLSLTLTAAFALAVSAQNIVFSSLDGDRIDVEAQKGKVVVMAIGASWLPLSNDQADTINKLTRKYTGRTDVVFYFIATDSESANSKNFASDDDLRKFSRKNKLNITILRDSDGQKSVKRYNLDQLPAFIILDKQGRTSGEPISGIDPLSEIDTMQIIANKIDSLL
jgi:peroxiredoxin